MAEEDTCELKENLEIQRIEWKDSKKNMEKEFNRQKNEFKKRLYQRTVRQVHSKNVIQMEQ